MIESGEGEGEEIESRVSIVHFVRGCLRLKGPAKNIDLVVMRHELEMFTKRWTKFASVTKKHLKQNSDSTPSTPSTPSLPFPFRSAQVGTLLAAIGEQTPARRDSE